MTKTGFVAQVEVPATGTLVLRLEGNLRGTAECYAFQDDVRERISGGASRIILDMQGVERVDSAGVGILAGIYTTAQNAEARLILAALTPCVQKLLDVLWFLRMLEHVESVDAALRRFEEDTPPKTDP